MRLGPATTHFRELGPRYAILRRTVNTGGYWQFIAGGGTPLRWALYAWAGGGPHKGDSRYYSVVKLLVAAGATLEGEWFNADESGGPIAKRIRQDAAMREALGGKLG